MSRILRSALPFLLVSVVAWADEPSVEEEGHPFVADIAEWSPVVVLPVQLEDVERSFLFMIDLRATIGVVDPRLRNFMERRLGNNRYWCPDLDISGWMLDGAEVICRDLTPLREQTGQEIDGILTGQQLRLVTYRIDVARGRFRVLMPDQIMKGSEFTLDLDRRNVATELILGTPPRRHLFEADFRSRRIVTLESDLFDSLVSAGAIQRYNESGVDNYHEGIVDRIGIEDQVYTKVPVHKGDRNTFGLLFFQNDTISLDQHFYWGWIIRNTAPKKREWVPWHGIAFWKPGGRITIDRVAPRGPAARAGLRAGDVIESINAGPVRYLPVSEVEFHDAWETGRVEIKYLRDGEQHKATMIRDKRPDQK